MRTRLLAALCVLAAVPRAFAQDPMAASPMGAAFNGTSETDATDVVDEPSTPSRRKDGDHVKMPSSGEAHTVVRGDTLWDLSEKYLGSPWYWPKVWSHNPEIANPHWIYPGNVVRFSAAGEDMPPGAEVAQEDAVDAEGAADSADTALTEAHPDGNLPGDGVQVAGKIGYQGNAHGERMVMVNGFVTQDEIDEAGRITGSFEEKEMLSYPDRAYVTFKKRSDARVGDRYLVFRTDKNPVKHPVTGKKLGYLTHILGTMKVVALSEKLVTAQVMDSRDEITRGNLVGPAGEALDRRISAKANDKELQAVVVTALVPYLSLMGEHHVVVIDKGAADGVQAGNTFVAYRQSDLGGDFMRPQKADKDLPKEDIATCVAVEVKDRLSTCMLTRSIREVVPGDRVEMRRANAKTASR